MARKQKLIHLHGTTNLTIDKAKTAGMAVGEIAIKNAATEGASELYVLTQDGNKVETFITSTAIDARIKVVGDKVDALVGDNGSIATQLGALKVDLEGQIDGVESAFNTYKTNHDTEYAQFKDANTKAIATAKKAGDDAAAAAAQALIDANAYTDSKVDGKFDAIGSAAAAEGRVNATIGTVTAGKTVVEMIAAAQKAGTDAAATAESNAKNYTNAAEGRVNATIGTVTEGETVVSMIAAAAQAGADAAAAAATAESNAKAYAKEYTDNHEKKNIHITADERTLWTNAANGFNTFMDGEGLDSTLDTLIEIQEWLKNDNNKDASDIIQMISTETSERQAADKKITDSIGTVTEGKTVVEMIAAAEDAAKSHANNLAGNYDAAGSAAAVETRLNEKIGTLPSGSATVAAAIAAAKKAGEDAAAAAEGRVNATIGTVTEGETVVSMIAAAEDAAKSHANNLAGNYDAAGSAATAESNAKAYAKEYADDAIEALASTVTGKNEYVASTHAGTNLGVTVVQTNGKLTSLTIDDSNLVIDCGTYDA